MRGFYIACYMVSIVGFSIASQVAVAVDSTGLSGRFGLVGVISDDSVATAKKKTPGVAVLKDRHNGVTMTLKTGESIPYEANLKVTGVRRNLVTISDGKTEVQVTYVGSSFDGPAAKPKEESAITDLTEPLFSKDSTSPGYAEPEKPRYNEPNDSESKPRFVAPGWIESNSVRITSEYLPLEEIDEENFEFE